MPVKASPSKRLKKKKTFERLRERRARPTLNEACDQHSSNVLFGTYRDNVDICDGSLPVDQNLKGKTYLREGVHDQH